MPVLHSLNASSRARPQLLPLWATLSRLLDASCLLAQALGPSFERLVTVARPFVPAVLCLPTLCLGKWELQHVCCVNTSWSLVIKIAEVTRPHPPAARVPRLQPLPGRLGWVGEWAAPMPYPFTPRTARPGLGMCLEAAKAAPGRERYLGRASTVSPWHSSGGLPGRVSLQAIEGCLGLLHPLWRIPLTSPVPAPALSSLGSQSSDPEVSEERRPEQSGRRTDGWTGSETGSRQGIRTPGEAQGA